jgi:putative transposase
MTTMTISKELLDELLSGVERPEDLLGDKGLMQELKVRLIERMLGAELTDHPLPGRALRSNGPRGWGMNRAESLPASSPTGAVPIDIPRDRDGSFEPELI